MTKAVLYARFSPRPNAAACESVANQLKDLRYYCDSRDWEVIAEHSDEALSGNDLTRPGLWDAVAALSRGHVLLVTQLDRLTRDYLLFAQLQKQAKKEGWKIVSADGVLQMEMTPERKLVAGILAQIAEYQREITAARTKRRMREHQANGRKMGGIAPYGLQIDPDDPKRYVPNQQEQETVALIMELREQGLGFQRIANEIDSRGIRARNGKCFYPALVRSVVRRHA